MEKMSNLNDDVRFELSGTLPIERMSLNLKGKAYRPMQHVQEVG